jgi:hypothetical protein
MNKSFLDCYLAMKYFTFLLLILLGHVTFGQIGTYMLNGKNGVSSRIALSYAGAVLNGEVFAWWGNSSNRHGVFTGEGKLNGKMGVLRSSDDQACKINLIFAGEVLKVEFEDCMNSNLPEDFSGTYKKISAHVAGSYSVVSTKAYFYKSANSVIKTKTYLVSGNKVEINLEAITSGNWVFASYTNDKGKTTSGFLLWSDLAYRKEHKP